jgi:aldose 1-epimerase
VVGVVLTHTSPDGDEGYPGAFTLRATYTLTPPMHWKSTMKPRQTKQRRSI